MVVIKKLCIRLHYEGKTHEAVDQSQEKSHSYCIGKFYLLEEEKIYGFSATR